LHFDIMAASTGTRLSATALTLRFKHPVPPHDQPVVELPALEKRP
jgi:hypothetical protein